MIMRLGYDRQAKKSFTELDGIITYFTYPEQAMLQVTKFLLEEINGKVNPNSGTPAGTTTGDKLPQRP